jgi:hypothetical protein
VIFGEAIIERDGVIAKCIKQLDANDKYQQQIDKGLKDK